MIAFTISACGLGRLTVTCLAAPAPDYDVRLGGPFLRDVARAVLEDLTGQVASARTCAAFEHRWLAPFLGTRALSLTLTEETIRGWLVRQGEDSAAA